MAFDLATLSPLELLRLHSSIGDQLRERGLTRSSNNPVGDLAETLFCEAFDWTMADLSMPAADAVGNDGTKYQIKARRLTKANSSRQLSAIRNLDQGGFDILAGVLFSEDYSIFRAALIPICVVRSEARIASHTNSHRFLLRDSVWEIEAVTDVTEQLKNVARRWDDRP